MAEVVIKIGDQANGGYVDGDVVSVYTDEQIAAKWEEAARLDPNGWGQVPEQNRTHAPLSEEMLSRFLVLKLPSNVSAVAAKQLRMTVFSGSGSATIVHKRRFRLSWQTALGLTQQQIDDIEDLHTVVDLRGQTFNAQGLVVDKVV